ENHKPMGGCRITYPKEGIGKIERVCVVREKQKSGYGSILIKEAEKWLMESGIRHIVINSQDRAAGFYNKLGYVTNLEVSPSIYEKSRTDLPPADEVQKEVHRKNLGFTCVLVEKYINA
ncbi:MAG: GNAT family N-acetyltransferase, partial [Lachnospiraceae bacterium]|nr:GNAT family N-acetyltransferase [Lachnospiraceae bacterium]